MNYCFECIIVGCSFRSWIRLLEVDSLFAIRLRAECLIWENSTADSKLSGFSSSLRARSSLTAWICTSVQAASDASCARMVCAVCSWCAWGLCKRAWIAVASRKCFAHLHWTRGRGAELSSRRPPSMDLCIWGMPQVASATTTRGGGCFSSGSAWLTATSLLFGFASDIGRRKIKTLNL